jgi:hypothetical protein
MAYAPSSDPVPTNANSASSTNRPTTKEEIGCRVIRNEKDWKWGKQVSITNPSIIILNRLSMKISFDTLIIKCNISSQ